MKFALNLLHHLAYRGYRLCRYRPSREIFLRVMQWVWLEQIRRASRHD